MATQTGIANALDHAGDAAMLDRYAKKIFSHEAILAPLMRMCIPEFADCTDEFIVANCFEEKPLVSAWPVNQDEGVMLDGDQRVTQLNSEENAASERTIHYDIRFTAKVPKGDELIKLIINLEIQVTDQLRYRVVTRGIYYGARMISAQYGTVFTRQEYQKLQKVYSIWICPESGNKEHSITTFRMQQIRQLGNLQVSEADYDKLQVIVITLGPNGIENENSLIRYLSLLLHKDYPLESRKQLLQDEYKITMNRDMEEEMRTVCNLGEGIARISRAEGRAEGFLEALAGLVKDGILSINEAAKRANLSVAEFCQKTGLTIVQ